MIDFSSGNEAPPGNLRKESSRILTWPLRKYGEDLRLRILMTVIPAYRSFFGKYEFLWGQSKLIKYTPEDLENLLLDLFEGTAEK